MVTLSPVGLAAAPVANQVSFLATFKEKLCRCVCATSTNQPFATVTYRNETPVLNGTTVFVPIVATITITTPNACKCQAETQVINERFVVAFQGRTTLPASVTINQLGMTQGLIQGKATQVSFPRLEMNQKTGKTEMVVDVTIEANGKMATYAIPESHSVTYAGHLVLSTEKSGLTSEVEAQKANAEQVLASASKAQNIIDKAPSLLAELNPMYKEKQETEQRFGKIEKSISGMEELMKKQQEMMENFIKKFES